HNTAASLDAIAHDHNDGAHTESSGRTHVNRNTTYIGFGGRMRLGVSTYLAAEVAVRVQGYAPDQSGYGVSIEKRVGAHMFSLTFTNTFATTWAQLARGGAANSLFLGFNLGRKFFYSPTGAEKNEPSQTLHLFCLGARSRMWHGRLRRLQQRVDDAVAGFGGEVHRDA